MLGRRQTIFWTSYFQFEKRFDFLFIYMYVMYIRATVFCVCLPGIMEHSITNDDITDAHISATIQQILTKFSAVVTYIK